LESQPADDAEVRSRLSSAISRIRNTDPYFLVRSHERRVSVNLKDVPLVEAHSPAFSGFPVAAGLRGIATDKTRVSLKLENAGFWEAVERFRAATGTSLDVDAHPGVQLRIEKPSKSFRADRQGRFLLSAQASAGRIVLKLTAEPGLQPVRVTFHLQDVKDPAGRSVLDRLTVDPPSGKSCSLRYGTFPAATLAVLTGPADVLADGTPFRIEGKAVVDLARDVEAVQFRRGAPEGETRTLSGCRLTLKSFDVVGESSFRFDLACEGAKGWKAPADRPYLGLGWIVIADDEGRSHITGTVGLAGRMDQDLQSGWEFPRPPTRLCVIQPTDVERVEIPVALGP
jgi:hypothetical protein